MCGDQRALAGHPPGAYFGGREVFESTDDESSDEVVATQLEEAARNRSGAHRVSDVWDECCLGPVMLERLHVVT
jgi:hypothetical protein